VLHDADKVMLYDVTWIATVVKHGETWWTCQVHRPRRFW
jgi:hypothetical protein